MRPSPPPPPESVKWKPTWHCKTRVVLITRLFGGGAKTREIDKISWLRSSAAKSALRAWWRSAHAHEFPSLAALRECEQSLFGAPGTFDADGKVHGGPGPLEVLTHSQLTTSPVDYREPVSNPLNYALFPAQGMGQAPAKVVAVSEKNWATVKLMVRSNDDTFCQAYLNALQLWLTFGGVGSRTRRGAGAVAAANLEEAAKVGLPLTLHQLEGFLAETCRRQEVPKALESVFCLARTRRIFVGSLQPNGEEAQKRLLSVLREARQDRPRPPAASWGRSRWPEADAIRLKVDPKKGWRHSPNRANADQYPRAALGLPIVLHYKDDPPVEPPEHHILAALPDEKGWRKLDRYSSPILVRPVRVWEQGREQYVPVALFTDCTFPTSVRPLVTTEPKAEARPSDVARTFEIRKHADATLRRIESAFERSSEFRSL